MKKRIGREKEMRQKKKPISLFKKKVDGKRRTAAFYTCKPQKRKACHRGKGQLKETMENPPEELTYKKKTERPAKSGGCILKASGARPGGRRAPTSHKSCRTATM